MSSTRVSRPASVSRSDAVAARTLSWMPLASITSILARIEASMPRTSSIARLTLSTTIPALVDEPADLVREVLHRPLEVGEVAGGDDEDGGGLRVGVVQIDGRQPELQLERSAARQGGRDLGGRAGRDRLAPVEARDRPHEDLARDAVLAVLETQRGPVRERQRGTRPPLLGLRHRLDPADLEAVHQDRVADLGRRRSRAEAHVDVAVLGPEGLGPAGVEEEAEKHGEGREDDETGLELRVLRVHRGDPT